MNKEENHEVARILTKKDFEEELKELKKTISFKERVYSIITVVIPLFLSFLYVFSNFAKHLPDIINIFIFYIIFAGFYKVFYYAGRQLFPELEWKMDRISWLKKYIK